ncbi:hypothetical protein PHET_09448 [Paragonimus heterotremus]|uniref:Uncharacterized protein n=1 Tax=Paragonimus heterotremus TaxID=100268 RepID=A0A8J4SM11_9TREM|nr:hypothetical protein PHET_09448 [Paragonimus heterotremus]
MYDRKMSATFAAFVYFLISDSSPPLYFKPLL